MLVLGTQDADLATAVALLRRGELVALPTETVYGLAADAANPAAVRGIFVAKGRPADHPLILHLAGAEALPRWCEAVPEVAWRLAADFWPGPLTLVLRAGAGVSPLVTGGQPTVAVRVPAHPVMHHILRELDRALAAPSANPFGRVSPTTAAHVRLDFAGRIAAVVDGGPCAVGIESTILDLSGATPTILRPGAITAAMLAPYVELAVPRAEAPRVPGALASHYAPRTPCYRVNSELTSAPPLRGRLGVLALESPAWPVARFWPMPRAPREYAARLYAALREADASGCDALLILLPPDTSEWYAVRDRLARATRALPERRPIPREPRV